MVVARSNYDDEISTLSFMEGSVQSGSIRATRRASQESHEESVVDARRGIHTNEEAIIDTTHNPLPMINTNDYDAKGRCIHHPHIKLRKKKLFGKGSWKVLMSACPDCCVDELRRIRMVEENKRRMREKQAVRRERSSERQQRSSADRTSGVERSERSDNKSLDGSYKSFGSRGSGHGSRKSTCSRSNGSLLSPGSMGSSPSIHSQRQSFNSQDSFNNTPNKMMVPPPPPPRPSSSLHQSPGSRSPTNVHDVPLSKSDKARRSSDETASLTESSRSGSSNEMQMRNDDSLRSSVRSSDPNIIKLAQRSPSVDGGGVHMNLSRNVSQGSSSRGSSRHARGNSSTGKKSSPRTRSTSRSQDPHQQQQQQQQSQQFLPSHQAVATQASSSSSNNNNNGGAPTTRGTIHVRQMQWIDPKNGKSGTYTGQVNDRFVPHGKGSMEYDIDVDGGSSSSTEKKKDGEWKNGRYRRSNNDSSNNGRSSGSRTRSKSRDNAAVRRSSSRSCSKDRRQRSTSRQPVLRHQQISV